MTSASTHPDRPLKVGLYLPNGDGYMSSPSLRGWSGILEMARLAEEVGFDSIWAADHMIFRFPGDEGETQGRWECWSLLSAIAAVTSRVEIGPLVSCMSFRNPALLAKMAETVDEISGGRLLLAVGAGWHAPEYTAFGFPYDHRASRVEEGFTILRDLIRTGRSSFAGRFEHTDDCELRPRGPRPGGLPLIVGTNGDRLLRVAASHADGWNTTWVGDPSAIASLSAAVDRACDDVGRDPATLSRSACVYLTLPDGTGRFAIRSPEEPEPMSPPQIVDTLHRYHQQGLDHVMVWLDPSTPAAIEAFGAILVQLDRSLVTVLPPRGS